MLGKLVFKTLEPASYRLLARWHTCADAGRYAAALQATMVIDEARIEALAELDPLFILPASFPLIRTRESALELNAALKLIKEVCSSATDEALAASARDLQGRKTVSAWCEGWLRCADRLPPPPFKGDESCFPLITAEQIIDAGERFKNCLGSRYLAPAISGKIAIVEFGPGLAIALLLRLHDGHWLILSCHAPQNKPISPDLAVAAEQKILSFGPNIHARAPVNRARNLLLQKYLVDDSLDDFDLLIAEH